ncbi:MAG TPA: SIR2 family protein [Thermoanaerobaculia bacterium]|nr:SIR2 family protein [Thermoanaerobaculia bacterium]
MRTPYKFLYPYELADAPIFFGREREIRILLSDIVVNRLVVLFARTGTGKTSLINAGVRPRLSDRGYATFFIRVRKNPEESLRQELAKSMDIGNLQDQSMERLLENIAKNLDKPIVLFFDQFEEFFLYVWRDDPSAAQAFIANIAKLYVNRDLGVHFVLSMREEFFVELEAFRDEIPNIFHNESNLRLRWFDRDQAREAIVNPALASDSDLDPDLVNRLLDDLWDEKKLGIEPAQLQVVCDTLWRAHSGTLITIEDYEQIGLRSARSAGSSSDNFSRELLYQRLEDGFQRIETEEQLQLLARLLPELRTERHTKALRDFEGLMAALSAGRSDLRELIQQLEQARLIRTTVVEDSLLIELLHDYLVDWLDELGERVQLIWPRRVLAEAMNRFVDQQDTIEPEQLRLLLSNAQKLRLAPVEAEMLFRAALAHGASLEESFAQAVTVGVPVWDVLREIIGGSGIWSAYIIRFLGQQGSPEAFELLKAGLSRVEIAPYVLEVLTWTEAVPGVDIIASALGPRELATDAERALERLASYSPSVEIQRYAKEKLLDYRGRPTLTSLTAGSGEEPFAGRISQLHIVAMTKALERDRLTLVLGQGINSAGWLPGALAATAETSPPNLAELARYLGDRFECPVGDRHDIRSVAQFVSMIYGREILYKELRQIFEREYPPTQVCRGIVALVRSQNLRKFHEESRRRSSAALAALADESPRRLIVSTSYDDVLERTFEQMGEAFEVVTYLAESETKARFLLRDTQGRQKLLEDPYEYQNLGEGAVTIFKPFGGVNRENRDLDSFVISEDDCLEYLLRRRGLPLLESKLSRSHLLFLGSDPREWQVFALVRLLSNRELLRFQSWAVQHKPDEFSRRFWRSRGTELLDAPLDLYMATFESQITPRS